MDSLSENSPQGENIKIPQEWKFKERRTKGLRVVQIDEDERFLGVVLPSGQEHRDYFFDPKGDVIASRSISNFDTFIGMGTSDIETLFFIRMSPQEISLDMSITFLPEKGEGRDNIASLGFEEGKLRRVKLGEIFGIDKDGNIIRSPSPFIALGKKREGLNSDDWQLSSVDSRFDETQMQDKSNDIVYEDIEGNKVFRLTWEAIDGKLVVTETHLLTGIIRTISAPLVLPMDEVRKAALARPPYQKVPVEGIGGARKEVLDVPWVSIDRIVGVNTTIASR